MGKIRENVGCNNAIFSIVICCACYWNAMQCIQKIILQHLYIGLHPWYIASKIYLFSYKIAAMLKIANSNPFFIVMVGCFQTQSVSQFYSRVHNFRLCFLLEKKKREESCQTITFVAMGYNLFLGLIILWFTESSYILIIRKTFYFRNLWTKTSPWRLLSLLLRFFGWK